MRSAKSVENQVLWRVANLRCILVFHVAVERLEAWSIEVCLKSWLPVAKCIFEVVERIKNIAFGGLPIRRALLISTFAQLLFFMRLNRSGWSCLFCLLLWLARRILGVLLLRFLVELRSLRGWGFC